MGMASIHDGFNVMYSKIKDDLVSASKRGKQDKNEELAYWIGYMDGLYDGGKLRNKEQYSALHHLLHVEF